MYFSHLQLPDRLWVLLQNGHWSSFTEGEGKTAVAWSEPLRISADFNGYTSAPICLLMAWTGQIYF
jgi:hypothetical protein